MSIRSLTALAVEREKALPTASTVSGGSGGAGNGSVPQSITDTLTAAIPTEPLAAYTAAIGILVGIPITGVHAVDKYIPFRWGVFAAFLVLTFVTILVSYTTKKNSAAPIGVSATADGKKNQPRKLPGLEMSAALIAASAWGLAMPGSALNTELSGNVAKITAASIAIGGSALLALVSMGLTKPSSTTTKPTPPPAVAS
jgi:hypothetical protein